MHRKWSWKRKSNQIFVQVNTQIFMMCPLSVLVLGNFCGEKLAWPRHRLAIFYFGFRVGVTLQAPKSFLIMGENQQVRYPDPIGIRFDPSGRISRVIAEVKPYEDWLLLHPFLSLLWSETTISRCESVCIVLNSEVCVENTS